MTLEKDLAALLPLRNELNKLDDRLSDEIAQIESALRAHVSIRITTTVSDGVVLAFGKMNGKWRLVVERDDNREALASGSRGQRAAIFRGRYIEQLISEAATQIAFEIAERKEAIEASADLRALLADTMPVDEQDDRGTAPESDAEAIGDPGFAFGPPR